jgi:GNAT superfamily N-acetyltransferase
MSFSIREAKASDVPTILALVRELAVYEKEPNAVRAREEDFLRDGFGASPKFFVLIAEHDAPGAHGEQRRDACGFAFYFFAYSTWEGRPVLALEDLFVTPDQRGNGVGRALMQRLARIALDASCTRFEWRVLDWNAPAKAFYEKLGATVLSSWEPVRIEGAALARLAS